MVRKGKDNRKGNKEDQKKGKSPTKQKTRSMTPGNEERNVNKRQKCENNSNENAAMDKKVRKTCTIGNTKDSRKVQARVQEDNQYLDMEVGQDAEFLSEDESDGESNVIMFKENQSSQAMRQQEQRDIEQSSETDAFTDNEEAEDGELVEILEHNYRIAGLSEERNEQNKKNSPIKG